jgi:hypothetical protein
MLDAMNNPQKSIAGNTQVRFPFIFFGLLSQCISIKRSRNKKKFQAASAHVQ